MTQREGVHPLCPAYLLEGSALAPTFIQVFREPPQGGGHMNSRLRLAAVAHESQNKSNAQNTAGAWRTEKGKVLKS